jgi:hypothetical protein
MGLAHMLVEPGAVTPLSSAGPRTPWCEPADSAVSPIAILARMEILDGSLGASLAGFECGAGRGAG